VASFGEQMEQHEYSESQLQQDMKFLLRTYRPLVAGAPAVEGEEDEETEIGLTSTFPDQDASHERLKSAIKVGCTPASFPTKSLLFRSLSRQAANYLACNAVERDVCAGTWK
jgi:hypothetical protein